MSGIARGFTLIELMIVVVIIGVLAVITIPNFVAMQDRAKEGATKANIHSLQMAAEDFSVLADGTYATEADSVASRVPGGFRNAFDNTTGKDNAWEDRTTFSADPTARSGIASYADSASGYTYNIKAHGKNAMLELILSVGH